VLHVRQYTSDTYGGYLMPVLWQSLQYISSLCGLLAFLPFSLVSWGVVRLSPLGTSATIWLIVPTLHDDHVCGAVSGMRTGRGNQSTP
jgi:hypothetical protein